MQGDWKITSNSKILIIYKKIMKKHIRIGK